VTTNRAEELLLKRATEGLDDREARELATLGAAEDISFDLAAASIDIATLRDLDDLPAGLADKVLVSAGVKSAIPATLAGVMPSQLSAMPSTLAGVTPARPIATSPFPPQPTELDAPITNELAVAREKKRSRAPMIFAYTAAAAGIALAIGAVLWANNKPPKVITNEIVKITPTLSPSQARAELLATANDATTLAWTATTDEAAKGASGDVVWSASKQQGFMRFAGLAANDPAKLQYQLWIFDKNRDQAFPVDGGVFDVTPNGEVIVPITAKLHVDEPVLFAVTVEKPGGVVVSKRERIVVTAAPKAS
jgi:hypothetical protein